MGSDDDPSSRSTGSNGSSGPSEPPTLFEKPARGVPQKPSGSRVPVGVVLGVILAVLVIVAVVLFVAASCGGAGPNGSTTGAGSVVLLPVLVR